MINYCSIAEFSHEYKKLKCINYFTLWPLLLHFWVCQSITCVAFNNLKHLLKYNQKPRIFKNINLLLWPILFWIDICLRNFVNIIITKPYIWISIITINVVSFLSKSYVHFDTLRSCHFLTPSFGHSLHRNKWKRYRF